LSVNAGKKKRGSASLQACGDVFERMEARCVDGEDVSHPKDDGDWRTTGG
jgi:hypothetical protein